MCMIWSLFSLLPGYMLGFSLTFHLIYFPLLLYCICSAVNNAFVCCFFFMVNVKMIQIFSKCFSFVKNVNWYGRIYMWNVHTYMYGVCWMVCCGCGKDRENLSESWEKNTSVLLFVHVNSCSRLFLCFAAHIFCWNYSFPVLSSFYCSQYIYILFYIYIYFVLFYFILILFYFILLFFLETCFLPVFASYIFVPLKMVNRSPVVKDCCSASYALNTDDWKWSSFASLQYWWLKIEQFCKPPILMTENWAVLQASNTDDWKLSSFASLQYWWLKTEQFCKPPILMTENWAVLQASNTDDWKLSSFASLQYWWLKIEQFLTPPVLMIENVQSPMHLILNSCWWFC